MTQAPIIALAPMAGVTDWPFRLLCREQGCDAATTEMVSANGLCCSPKEHNAYRFLLATAEGETPAAQLFGHEPYYLAKAADALTSIGRFSALDINMGCPAHKVTSGGSGSALMKTPTLAREVVRAVKGATLLPVTLKMRLGWDEDSQNAVEIAKMAQDEGVSAITVHGRTRAQGYSGKADWLAIARVREAVSVPVYANGDVFTAQDALEALRVTGCAGLAVGRGALGDPFLFSRIKKALAGEPYVLPEESAVIATAMRHARMMADWKGEESAVLEMRKHFAWYLKGRRGAAKMRVRVNTATTLAEVMDILSGE